MAAVTTDGTAFIAGPVPGLTPIAACVIAFQEADRIEDCVRSLAFCQQILVVDSGSQDRTRELAAGLGAEVLVKEPFLGHREQKQWAVDRAAFDWVLCLDADERVTPELRARIEDLQRTGFAHAAYEMPRRNHYLGRVVRRGLFWPDRKVRLFDRRRARWGGINPHDKVIVPADLPIQRLEEPIEHLSFRSMGHHLQTIDAFTRIAARALRAEGRRTSWLDLLVRPTAVIVKSLVIKRGFVDGWRGLVIAGLAGYYDWLKYWRLRQEWRR